MTVNHPPLGLQDVLDEFMMEDDQGSEVLARYVREYPQFAAQLVDFSILAASDDSDDQRELSAIDQSRVDAAWIAFSAIDISPASDPLAKLTGEKGRSVARALGVPRQVVSCFREHKVIATSVPNDILRLFADELEVPMAYVISAMSQPLAGFGGRQFKADGKPSAGEQVSFEQVLIDAGVSEADRLRLLSKGG
ncbi:hypothetical protein CHY08_27375 (plasmid) [Rhizobium leguminosarum bv. viciae]|uniref:hypothetical protein n=1 Tax=Rhizobium leguminosarum TaxID=384 RepID=UPI000B8C8870|nr:hypothetical protein [Rhizobium leguminosarum]ASR10799.1 hypothetical protein CHY08_27375 [Rhizobium leguminosarum bv. viciae]